jgi:hypothetical protein
MVFLVHLYFDCDPSHEIRSGISTCGIMSKLKKFWILEHVGFHIFGLGMLSQLVLFGLLNLSDIYPKSPEINVSSGKESGWCLDLISLVRYHQPRCVVQLSDTLSSTVTSIPHGRRSPVTTAGVR